MNKKVVPSNYHKQQQRDFLVAPRAVELEWHQRAHYEERKVAKQSITTQQTLVRCSFLFSFLLTFSISYFYVGALHVVMYTHARGRPPPEAGPCAVVFSVSNQNAILPTTAILPPKRTTRPRGSPPAPTGARGGFFPPAAPPALSPRGSPPAPWSSPRQTLPPPSHPPHPRPPPSAAP